MKKKDDNVAILILVIIGVMVWGVYCGKGINQS